MKFVLNSTNSYCGPSPQQTCPTFETCKSFTASINTTQTNGVQFLFSNGQDFGFLLSPTYIEVEYLKPSGIPYLGINTNTFTSKIPYPLDCIVTVEFESSTGQKLNDLFMFIESITDNEITFSFNNKKEYCGPSNALPCSTLPPVTPTPTTPAPTQFPILDFCKFVTIPASSSLTTYTLSDGNTFSVKYTGRAFPCYNFYYPTRNVYANVACPPINCLQSIKISDSLYVFVSDASSSQITLLLNSSNTFCGNTPIVTCSPTPMTN